MQVAKSGAEMHPHEKARWGARAKVRGVTRDQATGDLSLSFLTADGVCRFRISECDAAFLFETLENQRVIRRSHSDSSSGSPASDGSKPLDGKKV